jgi:transcriptional regulator with XRE-family HTH domain
MRRGRAGGLGPELGREIRARRRARGLTLVQLAARCGLSPTYLSQLETGAEDNPTIGVLRALAGGLEIPLGQLLPELGQPAAPPLAPAAQRLNRLLADPDLPPAVKRLLEATVDSWVSAAGDLGARPTPPAPTDLLRIFGRAPLENWLLDRDLDPSLRADLLRRAGSALAPEAPSPPDAGFSPPPTNARRVR